MILIEIVSFKNILSLIVLGAVKTNIKDTYATVFRILYFAVLGIFLQQNVLMNDSSKPHLLNLMCYMYCFTIFERFAICGTQVKPAIPKI